MPPKDSACLGAIVKLIQIMRQPTIHHHWKELGPNRVGDLAKQKRFMVSLSYWQS